MTNFQTRQSQPQTPRNFRFRLKTSTISMTAINFLVNKDSSLLHVSSIHKLKLFESLIIEKGCGTQEQEPILSKIINGYEAVSLLF